MICLSSVEDQETQSFHWNMEGGALNLLNLLCALIVQIVGGHKTKRLDRFLEARYSFFFGRSCISFDFFFCITLLGEWVSLCVS